MEKRGEIICSWNYRLPYLNRNRRQTRPTAASTRGYAVLPTFGNFAKRQAAPAAASDVTPFTLKFFATRRLADVQRLNQYIAQNLARLNRVPMTRCRHPTTRYGLRYFTGTSG